MPSRKKWQPRPVFLPGKFHGQRSLAGSSPRVLKESEMTESLRTHTTKSHIPTGLENENKEPITSLVKKQHAGPPQHATVRVRIRMNFTFKNLKEKYILNIIYKLIYLIKVKALSFIIY